MLHRHPDFPSEFVRPRHVDVWLPPAYAAQPNGRFPVLYMHDGQNLFDPQTAYGGVTWGIPDAMTRLAAAGAIPPTLVVGVWNTEQRWAEYLPQRPFTLPGGPAHLARIKADFVAKFAADFAAPLSDAYLRFLVTELKPFIDAAYRTRPERAHTAVMGSSMGGLISLYALCEYPDTFAAAGCVSTHWPAVAGAILPYLRQALPAPGRHKLYFDYGTATLDAAYEPHQQQVDALLRAAGYTPGLDWLTRRFDGAEHNEAAWQARIDVPLTFLLGQAA